MRRCRAVWLAALVALSCLGACEVGPDYQRPEAPAPAKFKEAEGWKKAEPGVAASQGPWWSVYNDPELDGLMRQIDVSNQNLKAAEAAYRVSQAIVDAARASFFPTVTINGSGTRAGIGAGSVSSSGGGTRGAGGGRVANQFGASAGASWEPDLWGRIRRTVEGDVASAQASAADIAAARLSAQSQLATAYFELRIADELKRLLDATVIAYTEALRITRNQYQAGTAAETDVVQAETQVRTTQSQAINTGVQRAQFEHAIAVLIGKPPADFAIAPREMRHDVPVAPPGLPSALLERRPDIAAAERLMAQSNAQIGVAEAAFFPDITLTASYGVNSVKLGNLFNASSAAWSIGGTLAETVFDAGARSAQVAQARASYEQGVANYRQTVLTGFQQVEDELAALRVLEEQAVVQDDAVRLAKQAEQLILNQYKAGTVAYTNVVTAQTIALTNEVSAINILQNRLTASVSLIEALGGGWDASQLPTRDQVESDAPPPGTVAEPSEEPRSWLERMFGW